MFCCACTESTRQEKKRYSNNHLMGTSHDDSDDEAGKMKSKTKREWDVERERENERKQINEEKKETSHFHSFHLFLSLLISKLQDSVFDTFLMAC